MIVFALIVLAAIVGAYVYFARRVSKSIPVVVASVPAPIAAAPLADLAGNPDEPKPQG